MPRYFDGEDDGLAMERELDRDAERERPQCQRPALNPRGSVKQRFAPDPQSASEPQLSWLDVTRRAGAI